jgi:ADP-ribosylglycohydrolase
MRCQTLALLLAATLAAELASAAPPPAAPAAGGRPLARSVLEDKIRGGWAGQMIGVSYGAPTEFRSNGRILEGPIAWQPEQVEGAIDQDDLYVEMTFAEVMDRFGLDATSEQYGAMFRDSKYNLWHANAAARRLLNQGVKPPLTGDPKRNAHANDIDFQIESDFIGLMCPGLPRDANRYAERVGRVMNHGDGLYGGMFFSGMYAAAFFESDPRAVVEAGLRSIPAASGYARAIRDVLAGYSQYPSEWRKTWTLVTERWDKNDPCPDGALRPFNIDARLNGAYVALGLLYGGGDVAKTLEVATRAGQDSDCNPSSALGVLGVMLGYARIPEQWKSGIPRIAATPFSYTAFSFDTIVASTLARALRVIAGAGGVVGASELTVPRQSPLPPPLEQWTPDAPTARLELSDVGWTWGEGWTERAQKSEGSEGRVRAAASAGAECRLRFEGTGIALVGTMSQASGRADVFLDGRASGRIDAWVPPNTHDNDLWHATGLGPGPHEVRVVLRADHDERSTGSEVVIERAIVYGR